MSVWGLNPCRPSLDMRLKTGAAALVLLAIAGAVLAIWGQARLSHEAGLALDAQRGIEAWGSFQARSNEWALAWRFGAQNAQLRPDAAPVQAVLALMESLLSQGEPDQQMRLARLQAHFAQLEQALKDHGPNSPEGQMALSYHSSRAPGLLAQAIDHDTDRRDQALARMQNLRLPLILGALAIVIAAGLALALLYFRVFRPLSGRLRHAARDAKDLALGDVSGDLWGGHDELGLVFARQRQMAARLRRRQARLEQEVETRTADLVAAKDRLARIDANRRRFFADVGHELRTPLTVILGEAELGLGNADPEVRSSFQTVAARAGRLARRVDDMLRIARSESGQLELQPGPLDLRDCAEAALADVAPVLSRAGLTTLLEFPAVTVCADGEWLRQVFAGLFENAAKYAGAGAVLRVEVAPAPLGYAGLRISDTGRGLPQALQQRLRKDPQMLFARFARGETAPALGAGFGVGLALAYWVVKASGGQLFYVRPPSTDPNTGSNTDLNSEHDTEQVTDHARPGFALDLILPLWGKTDGANIGA